MTALDDEKTMEGLRLLMRPLVRFCLSKRGSFQTFTAMAKELFVEIAVEELAKSTTKVNTSRIAVLTGIYRQEVTKIYKERKPPTLRTTSILSRVLSTWEQHADFTTKNNRPRILTYEGESSEFEQLVGMVSKNVNAGTVLFELDRLGIIEKTPNGVKRVKQLAGIDIDPTEAYDLLGKDWNDLYRGVEENISNLQETSNLHLRTEYDNVFLDALPEVKKWLVEEGKRFHRRVRDFLSKLDKDIAPLKKNENRTGGGRVVITSFSFTEKPGDAEGEDDEKEKGAT